MRARFDQFEEQHYGQVKARNRIEKRGRYGIGHGLPLIGSFERVAPPLEADLAKQRFRDELIDARHFVVESIKGMNMPPPFLRNKEARKPAVLIVAADEILAIGVIRIARLNFHRGWQVPMRQELIGPVASRPYLGRCFRSGWRWGWPNGIGTQAKVD